VNPRPHLEAIDIFRPPPGLVRYGGNGGRQDRVRPRGPPDPHHQRVNGAWPLGQVFGPQSPDLVPEQCQIGDTKAISPGHGRFCPSGKVETMKKIIALALLAILSLGTAESAFARYCQTDCSPYTNTCTTNCWGN
jgi:hypothetical protein